MPAPHCRNGSFRSIWGIGRLSNSPIIHGFLIKGLHSAARKWGPFKDECHVACDKPYLTSYNVMANVQGTKLCPEYFNFPGNDILVTGANWRAMCKEKVKVL